MLPIPDSVICETHRHTMKDYALFHDRDTIMCHDSLNSTILMSKSAGGRRSMCSAMAAAALQSGKATLQIWCLQCSISMLRVESLWTQSSLMPTCTSGQSSTCKYAKPSSCHLFCSKIPMDDDFCNLLFSSSTTMLHITLCLLDGAESQTTRQAGTR